MLYTEKEQSTLCAPPPPTRCNLPSTRGGVGIPSWFSGKETTCQSRRHWRCWFDPWVGKILQRRKWQPTPVLLPGKSHVQSLLGYSPWGHKELDMTERRSVCTHTHKHTRVLSLSVSTHGLVVSWWRHGEDPNSLRIMLSACGWKCQIPLAEFFQISWKWGSVYTLLGPLRRDPNGLGGAEKNRARPQEENNYGNEMFCVSWNLEAGRDLLFWETTETSKSKMVLETLWNVQEKAFCEDCNLHFLEQRHCLSSGIIHRAVHPSIGKKVAVVSLETGELRVCRYVHSWPRVRALFSHRELCMCDGWSADASPRTHWSPVMLTGSRYLPLTSCLENKMCWKRHLHATQEHRK